MKRWLSVGLVAVLLFGLMASVSSAATSAPSFVSVVLDGKKIWFPDAQAYVDGNNRTLVPVRFVAETMGAEVGWEAETLTVPIDRDGQQILLTIGANTAKVNDEDVSFDTKAIMSGGRTFVPLRFVSEVLGAKVEWDGDSSTVFISTKEDIGKVDQWGRLIRTTNLPKNAADYPYILADVPNEMYEFSYPYSHPTDSEVSANLYKNYPEFNKQNVDIWFDHLRAFGASWLNVDYRTIDDRWAEAVFGTQIQGNQEALKYIKRYVDWVKENEIQIEGYLDPEPSMIYRDGFGNNFVRSKFRIRFIHFEENERLLFDTWFPTDSKFEQGVWYEGYTDIAIGTNVGGNWGKTLKVSPQVSLFFNHTIKKAG